ncbi:unnamed protein product [Penicillium salamii]|uniref:BTB domain-containing protein n=1 Tax=Penicillium salamii TaxID=1612424 RepID=A0A9W4J3H6_9EURO|nr:unnamed protein product [Penicillium salamii]
MAPAKRSHEPDNSSSQGTQPVNKRHKFDLATLGLDLNSLQKVDPDGDVVLSTPARCRSGRKSETTETNTHFLVSSKHLKMTSGYFKGLLSERWPGGQRDRPWHSISFQTLVDVSLAADFFQCTDVVELFALRWIDGLKADLPSKWTPKIPEWIMISVMFRHEDTFAHITEVAVENGTGPLKTQNLPIPAYIKGLSQSMFSHKPHLIALTLNPDRIDRSRERYLQKVLCEIEKRICTLVSITSPSPRCSPNCHTVSLAQLIRVLVRHNILFRLRPLGTRNIRTTSASLEGLSPVKIREMVMFNNSGPQHHCEQGVFCGFTIQPWGSKAERLAKEECAGVKMKKTR